MARFLIIAASSAIGQATTVLLRSQGHEVMTTARNHARIQPDFILDAADFDAVDEAFRQAGALDGAINCADPQPAVGRPPAYFSGE